MSQELKFSVTLHVLLGNKEENKAHGPLCVISSAKYDKLQRKGIFRGQAQFGEMEKTEHQSLELDDLDVTHFVI